MFKKCNALNCIGAIRHYTNKLTLTNGITKSVLYRFCVLVDIEKHAERATNVLIYNLFSTMAVSVLIKPFMIYFIT